MAGFKVTADSKVTRRNPGQGLEELLGRIGFNEKNVHLHSLSVEEARGQSKQRVDVELL